MPSFIIKDGRHFVAYVTGPSHVLLGMRLVEHAAEPVLVRQPPLATSTEAVHDPLDEARIRSVVLEELASIRAESGLEVHAAEIVYVEDDSPRYDLFRIAAGLLVRQYISGGEFRHVA